MSQAQTKLKILSTLGPNQTQKARPDLELWTVQFNSKALKDAKVQN